MPTNDARAAKGISTHQQRSLMTWVSKDTLSAVEVGQVTWYGANALLFLFLFIRRTLDMHHNYLRQLIISGLPCNSLPQKGIGQVPRNEWLDIEIGFAYTGPGRNDPSPGKLVIIDRQIKTLRDFDVFWSDTTLRVLLWVCEACLSDCKIITQGNWGWMICIWYSFKNWTKLYNMFHVLPFNSLKKCNLKLERDLKYGNE